MLNSHITATFKEESWIDLKARLKEEYPELTEDDLHSHQGKEDDMLRMVEYKLRKTRSEMEDIIRNFKDQIKN